MSFYLYSIIAIVSILVVHVAAMILITNDFKLDKHE